MSVEERLGSEGVSAITHSCSWYRCINLETRWHHLIADTPPSTRVSVLTHAKENEGKQRTKITADEAEMVRARHRRGLDCDWFTTWVNRFPKPSLLHLLFRPEITSPPGFVSFWTDGLVS